MQIFDSKTIGMVRDEYRIKQVTKAEANTLEELAQALEIDVAGFVRTVGAYNAACQPGDYNRPSSTASIRPGSRRPSRTGPCGSTSRPITASS